MRDVRFFVRDDDVGELTAALRYFVECFVSHRIPVSYQIIPSRLTPDCASYLLDVWSRNQELVAFGQHGLHHRMTLRGRELRREFGPERSYADQRAAISEGLAILRERLGDEAPIQVFTPPQHKFDRNTVRAASQVGYRIFSVSSYPTLHHQLAYAMGRALGWSSFAHHGVSYHGGRRPEADLEEVSIAIDVDDGRRLKRSGAEIAAKLLATSNASSVGLMFHHALYEGRAGEATLAEIADRLAEIGAERFVPLASLASNGPRTS